MPVASSSSSMVKQAAVPGPSTRPTRTPTIPVVDIDDDTSSDDEEDAEDLDGSDDSDSNRDSSDLDRAADSEEETFAEEVAALTVDADYQEEDSVTALVTVPVTTPSKL
jgi:hypothetical protein